jgi:hypothetical protein
LKPHRGSNFAELDLSLSIGSRIFSLKFRRSLRHTFLLCDSNIDPHRSNANPRPKDVGVTRQDEVESIIQHPISPPETPRGRQQLSIRLTMAPLSSDIAAAMSVMRIQTRGLGNDTTTALSISPAEGNILQILALVFSIISVASSVLAFYWFIKMRRSFRHE